MAEVDAGVDVRDDDALADDAPVPRLGRADLLDAPLRIARCRQDRDLGVDGLDERVDLDGPDRGDALELGELLRQLRVADDDHLVVEPVAGRSRAVLPGEGKGRRLRLVRVRRQRVDDEGAALGVALDLVRAAEIRLRR